MKPLHIGLLVAGAVLAGGLALKMAEPVAIPVAPALQPADPVVRHKVVSAPPVPVNVPVVKPSPMPPAPARASAPAPVYDEPARPAIRKFEPILKLAKWRPGPYIEPAQPLTPAAVVDQTVEHIAEPVPVTAKADVVVQKAVAITPPPAPPPSAPRHVTLRPGMAVPVRLGESLSPDKSLAGDTFQATLAEPLVVDGLVIAEKGARLTGRVVESQKARITGIAILRLELATVMTSDGQRVPVSTDPWIRYGPAGIPSETLVRFRLASRVTVTEQQVASR